MSYAGKAGIAALLGGVGQAIDNFANMTAQEYQRRKQEEAAELRQIRMMNLREQMAEEKLSKKANQSLALLRDLSGYAEENNLGLTHDTLEQFSLTRRLSGTEHALLVSALDQQLGLKHKDRQYSAAEDSEAVADLFGQASSLGTLEERLAFLQDSDASQEVKASVASKIYQFTNQQLSAEGAVESKKAGEDLDRILDADWFADFVSTVGDMNAAGNYKDAYSVLKEKAATVGVTSGAVLAKALDVASSRIGAQQPSNLGKVTIPSFPNPDDLNLTSQIFWGDRAQVDRVQAWISRDATRHLSDADRQKLFTAIQPELLRLHEAAGDSGWGNYTGMNRTKNLLSLLKQLMETGDTGLLQDIYDLTKGDTTDDATSVTTKPNMFPQ